VGADPRLPLAAVVAATLALAAAGCGADTTTADRRQALEEYVAKVQPIRLGINELLDKADPILEGYRDGDLSAKRAQRGIDRIERGAAGYAVRIAAIQDVPEEMQAAQNAYAHTFVLQDTYEQRAAIIAWRTRLQVLADRWGASLPADLQIAGRGEISPAPTGD
jgi:hypothetical protein